MDIRIINAIYITLFFVLSIALYVIIIPSKKEYTDYRKSRHIMASALMLTSILGLLRSLFPTIEIQHYVQICITLMVCYIFTCLNYISFMYMIETSRPMRKRVKKISLAVLAPVLILGLGGIFCQQYSAVLSIILTVLCVLMNIFLLNTALREYDKFILQMSNYYDNMLDIRWIPGMLWATFLIAMATSGALFYSPLFTVSGCASIFIFPYISIKLLSFIPSNIHVVREKVQENEIIAQEHPVEDIKPVITEDKESRKFEKVAALMGKWVQMEHFTQPDINIKDVASEMGTNSNYLSSYINKALGTSFSLWLNTLRIEKSKEYLGSKTKMSIEECGIKVGYQSLYNYSRWFKTITGMSPSEFRRSQYSK